MTWLNERQRDGGIDEVQVDGAPGSLWLCGKHRIGPDPEGVLASVDASVVVCLTEAHELVDRYPEYVEWLTSDPRARWFPIPDLSVPDEDEWTSLIAGMLSEVRSGRHVIVHCAAGIGRAALQPARYCSQQVCHSPRPSDEWQRLVLELVRVARASGVYPAMGGELANR